MVNILTDSASDLEPEEFEKLKVTCVPLSVTFGDREYRETLELSKAEFYKLLTDPEQPDPKTSQPAPVDFEAPLRAAKERGEGSVVITLSASLSGTYQNAVLAKERLEYEDCYIIDSCTAVGGQRLLVEYAVKLREEGKTAAEIAQAVTELRPRVTIYACIDTVEYLRRGGRISHLAAAVAAFAHVKPLIHVTEDGKIDIPAKAMGRQQGLKYLQKMVDALPPDPEFPFYAMYAAYSDNAEWMVKALKKQGVSIPKKNIINIGAAIGSHIGPRGFGYAYIRKADL